MKYVVQVPSKLFTGSMGLMDHITRNKFNIQAGTFLRYAATDNYQIWAITCSEQALMLLALTIPMVLLESELDRVCQDVA